MPVSRPMTPPTSRLVSPKLPGKLGRLEVSSSPVVGKTIAISLVDLCSSLAVTGNRGSFRPRQISHLYRQTPTYTAGGASGLALGLRRYFQWSLGSCWRCPVPVSQAPLPRPSRHQLTHVGCVLGDEFAWWSYHLVVPGTLAALVKQWV